MASGSADKQVIIWGGAPYEGKLKYTHTESIQKVAYNPKSPLVLSCTNIDFGKMIAGDFAGSQGGGGIMQGNHNAPTLYVQPHKSRIAIKGPALKSSRI